MGLRIDPVVKEALEAAAKAERRTVAAYVEKVLIEDLETKGFLPKGAAE